MSKPELVVQGYETVTGQSPFEDWLVDLRDRMVRATIYTRLGRLRSGNLGDCRPVGDGVLELKIHLGPGYRIYFGREGWKRIILLCGGTKKDQFPDIVKAKELWKEYQERKKHEASHKRLHKVSHGKT